MQLPSTGLLTRALLHSEVEPTPEFEVTDAFDSHGGADVWDLPVGPPFAGPGDLPSDDDAVRPAERRSDQERITCQAKGKRSVMAVAQDDADASHGISSSTRLMGCPLAIRSSVSRR
jgi:hypothetical protein